MLTKQEKDNITKLVKKIAGKTQTDALIMFVASQNGMLSICQKINELREKNEIKEIKHICLSNAVNPNFLFSETTRLLNIFQHQSQSQNTLLQAYKTLGLKEGADILEIKRAFRKLSLRHHPDGTNKDDDDSKKFIEICNAYQQLLSEAGNRTSDPQPKHAPWLYHDNESAEPVKKKSARKNLIFICTVAISLILISLTSSLIYEKKIVKEHLDVKNDQESLQTMTPSVSVENIGDEKKQKSMLLAKSENKVSKETPSIPKIIPFTGQSVTNKKLAKTHEPTYEKQKGQTETKKAEVKAVKTAAVQTKSGKKPEATLKASSAAVIEPVKAQKQSVLLAKSENKVSKEAPSIPKTTPFTEQSSLNKNLAKMPETTYEGRQEKTETKKTEVKTTKTVAVKTKSEKKPEATLKASSASVIEPVKAQKQLVLLAKSENKVSKESSVSLKKENKGSDNIITPSIAIPKGAPLPEKTSLKKKLSKKEEPDHKEPKKITLLKETESVIEKSVLTQKKAERLPEDSSKPDQATLTKPTKAQKHPVLLAKSENKGLKETPPIPISKTTPFTEQTTLKKNLAKTQETIHKQQKENSKIYKIKPVAVKTAAVSTKPEKKSEASLKVNPAAVSQPAEIQKQRSVLLAKVENKIKKFAPTATAVISEEKKQPSSKSLDNTPIVLDKNNKNIIRKRIKTFLVQYASAYERKDFDEFSRFFLKDATENGEAFKSKDKDYKLLFSRLEKIKYIIDLNKWEKVDGDILINGFFKSDFLFTDKRQMSFKGTITMLLNDEVDSLKVKTLAYKFTK